MRSSGMSAVSLTCQLRLGDPLGLLPGMGVHLPSTGSGWTLEPSLTRSSFQALSVMGFSILPLLVM